MNPPDPDPDPDPEPEELVITLGTSKWIPFTPGVDVATYSTITCNNVEYTATGLGGKYALFAVYQGVLYIGNYSGSSMTLFTNPDGHYMYITSGDTVSNGQAQGGEGVYGDVSLTPTNADLLDDLLDGGIELGQ